MSPVGYNYWYINGGGSIDTFDPSTNPNPADYAIKGISVSYNSTGTSATVTIIPATSSPASYGIIASAGSISFPDFVKNVNTPSFTLSPITPGSKYYLKIKAYSGTNQTGTYGEPFYETLNVPKPAVVASPTSTSSSTQIPPTSAYDRWYDEKNGTSTPNTGFGISTLDTEPEIAKGSLSNLLEDRGTSYATSQNRIVQTSLFKISVPEADKKVFSVATKNTNISTGYKHYAFGTSLFFQSDINNVEGSGGLGFFINNNGMNGYYLLIQTTANLAKTSDKEVKIIKIVDGKKVVLNDTQQASTAKTLTGILGGIAYKVDINVKVEAGKTTIDAYINNFKITAVDTSEANPSVPIDYTLPVTSKIALFAATGTASFDYVYATPLTEAQYKEGLVRNVYEGKYGIKTLTFLYGDKIVEDRTVSPDQLAFLEEFGTVARELRKVKVKYESRPGDPLFTSLGINKFVSVLGERLTSFGAEIYIVNNSGTFVPLDDSKLYSFSVIGNYIVTTGQHEYVSNQLSETTVAEPAIFESAWIQSENDAKNIASWIENQWSKQQQVVEMQIFSNPLISVGDIITINYPKNGLDGTQKFVVTQVNNSFKEGLETSISARSIYS